VGLNRTTLPTIAVTASVAALVSGLVVSTVRGHHDKGSPKSAAHATITVAQQQAIAHQLNGMALPAGITHSTVCPRVVTATEACFASSDKTPAASALSAADAAEQMLTSLGVTLGLTRSCEQVTAGPEGSGYSCQANGVWHGSLLSTTVFVSDAKTQPAGVPAESAILSVSADKA